MLVNNRQLVSYRDHHLNNRIKIVCFSDHDLNNRLFNSRSSFDPFNIRLVEYSDPHCTEQSVPYFVQITPGAQVDHLSWGLTIGIYCTGLGIN